MPQPAHSWSPEEERCPAVRRPSHLEEARHPLYAFHTEAGAEPVPFACLHRHEVIDEPSESGQKAGPLRRREAPNVVEERIRLFMSRHLWGGLAAIPLVRLRLDTCEELLAARVEVRSTGREVTGPVGIRSHGRIQISQCQFLSVDFGRWNRSHVVSPLLCLFNHQHTTYRRYGIAPRRGEWLLRSQSQP